MKDLDELGISPMPWRVDSDGMALDGNGYYLNEEMTEHLADARLIAAAPELYNALFTLVKINKEGAKEDMLIPAAYQYAKIVLAKASGDGEARVWCVNDPTRKCVDCEICAG